MGISTILVSLNETDQIDVLLKVTAGLASKHDAHVIGLYAIPAVYVRPVIYTYVTADIIDTGSSFFDRRAEIAEQKFNQAMKKEGFRGEWRKVDGRTHLVSSAVVEHGRMVDLIVVSQGSLDSDNGSEIDFADRVVLEGGRPVLLVPTSGTFDVVAQNVVIGWNATRESARAAFDAVALMGKGSKAHIVWVDSELQEQEEAGQALPGAELAASFARHGVETFSEPVATPGLEPVDALLTRVFDVGADMLVMGAYGHSRMREFIFGGSTRKVLDQMTVPVLMSH